ncbi:hypothetical protein H2203_005955 [Taxawa tesnikishii (nom. ined.)]|nr:hypothetical protein H2203_005955 [Dothideales sp. JES 119]
MLERVSEAASSPPVANGHGDHIPKEANGTTLRKRNPRSTTGTPNGEPGTTLRPAQRTGSFTWQFYPRSPFIERLDWVADIFCNFRGMGWNWRINGLPPPPRAVQEQLYENAGTQPSDADTHVSRTGARRYHDTPSLLRSNLIVAIRGYLILDLLKTMAVHDPYMWGVMGPGGMLDSPPPAYLPASLAAIPAIVKTCRLLLSLFAMFTALQTIFSLGPLFSSASSAPTSSVRAANPGCTPTATAPFPAFWTKASEAGGADGGTNPSGSRSRRPRRDCAKLWA